MSFNHRPLEESDIMLIERVEKAPCLYDPRDAGFRMSFRKDHEWEMVGDTLGMSDLEAKRRWTVLRERYSRELRQLRLNPDNTDIGKSQFFIKMDFIRPFVKMRGDRKRPVLELEGSVKSLKMVKLQDDPSYPFETIDLIEPDEEIQKQNEDSSREIDESIELNDDDDDDEDRKTHDYEVYPDSYDSETWVNHGAPCQNSANNLVSNVRIEKQSSSIRDNDIEREQSVAISPALQDRSVIAADSNSDSDELFSKVLVSYLKTLPRRYKIKAKVEMMQIVEKYIDMEENE